MIHDLDHEAALDPVRVGAKASWLARGRRSGLAILPGLVVDTAASRDHMRLGAEMLAIRGSGGARLAITAEPVSVGNELAERASRLSDLLVARSSTILEASGEWSGAFASYLNLLPVDLPRAVAGCWASAFSVASLDRQAAARVTPGSVDMAVLIQPALDPLAGGTAMIRPDGAIVVTGVKGSPAPLLQGWAHGLVAAEADGSWVGDELIDLLGLDILDEIAVALRQAGESIGAGRCEWALDDRIWLLQLGPDMGSLPPPVPHRETTDARLVRLARIVMRAGSRIGEDLIFPWALAGLPDPGPPIDALPEDAMTRAVELRDRLVAQVWDMPAPEALAAARSCMSTLLGPDPSTALSVIDGLSQPESEAATSLLALVGAIERDDPATRAGVRRWEPFVASVVLYAGAHQTGTPASPGIGAGLSSRGDFQRRSVVVAAHPTPNLAPLLWDAAGVVTESGSPAAHLFDSARALRVPGVCGVTVPPGDQIVAIDGHNGLVSTLPLHGDDDG